MAGAVERQAVKRTALALSSNSVTRNAAINEDLRELGGEPVGACDLGIGQGRGWKETGGWLGHQGGERGSTRGMRRVLPVLLLGLAEVIEHLVHLFQGEGVALVGAAGFPGDEVDGVPGAEAFIDGTLEDG